MNNYFFFYNSLSFQYGDAEKGNRWNVGSLYSLKTINDFDFTQKTSE